MSNLESGKGDIGHEEVIRDHDVLGEKEYTTEEAMHFGELTPEERAIEKKLRLRIDSLVMPLVILVYLMNYIDRNNYAAARLQGLEADLGLVGDQYQVGLSILFVGYVRCLDWSMKCGEKLTAIFRCSCKSRRMHCSTTPVDHRSTSDSSRPHGDSSHS